MRYSSAFRKICLLLVMSVFLLSCTWGNDLYAASSFYLHSQGGISPSGNIDQSMLIGIHVNPANPFQMDFIIRPSQGEKVSPQEASRQIKYFMAALTIPEGDLWVNLSPYEKNKIIPRSLGLTDMGQDLLMQDYVLKKMAALLTSPDNAIGKNFWKKIYLETYRHFGTTDIPVSTFNKVWAVPQQAVVGQHGSTAMIEKQELKVMLEEDYLAFRKHANSEGSSSQISRLSSMVTKSIILPEIEREVNYGENFSTLRQIFSAVILADWYKTNLKRSLINRIFTGKNKLNGIKSADPLAKQEIYKRYLSIFKKGVFNYIKEEYDPYTSQTLARHYFSGGFTFLGGKWLKTFKRASLKFFGPLVLVAAALIPQTFALAQQTLPSPNQTIVSSTVVLTHPEKIAIEALFGADQMNHPGTIVDFREKTPEGKIACVSGCQFKDPKVFDISGRALKGIAQNILQKQAMLDQEGHVRDEVRLRRFLSPLKGYKGKTYLDDAYIDRTVQQLKKVFQEDNKLLEVSANHQVRPASISEFHPPHCDQRPEIKIAIPEPLPVLEATSSRGHFNCLIYFLKRLPYQYIDTRPNDGKNDNKTLSKEWIWIIRGLLLPDQAHLHRRIKIRLGIG